MKLKSCLSLDLHSLRRSRNALHEASPLVVAVVVVIVVATAAPASLVGRRRCRFCPMFREGPLPGKDPFSGMYLFPGKFRLLRRDSLLMPRRDEKEEEEEEAVLVVKREGSWHCDGDGNRGVAVTFDILEQKRPSQVT